MLAQLKGAIELRKIMGISVNFEQYKRIVSRLDGVCSVGSQKMQKTTSCSPSGKYNGAIEIAKKLGWSQAKLKRYQDRMDLMKGKNSLIEEYVNKPEFYAKNFEVNGKYNMVKKMLNYPGDQNVTPFIIKDSSIKSPTGYTISGGSIGYDFIIQNGEMKMGKHHDFLSVGKNVDFAGKIYFTQKGKITKITEESGHFLPSLGNEEKSLITNILNNKGYTDQIIFDPIFTD